MQLKGKVGRLGARKLCEPVQLSGTVDHLAGQIYCMINIL